MGSTFDSLLLKAKLDKTKLVQVQRSVSRGGKTFTQNFWVKPSEVKSTDRIIGNQHNMLPKPGSVPKPADGVLDKAYLDSISSDKSRALDYLKKCGLSWNENTHAGINWMRAMQAVKTALNGQPSVTLKHTVSKQNTPNNSSQLVPGDVNTAMKMLDKDSQSEFNKCSNGREKVVFLKKKLGQDGCFQFARACGVSWDEHSHKAINNMRMSMALQEKLDSLAGTTSTKNDKGGAPKGNQNAKKDSSSKKDETKLEVPTNATQRQKNIIGLINKIDKVEDLQTYAGVGMIPEDDVAKSFIFDKLAPKYTLWKNAHGMNSSKKSQGKTKEADNSKWGFARVMTSSLNVEGTNKDSVKDAFGDWYEKFRVGHILDSRNMIRTSFDAIKPKQHRIPISNTLTILYKGYSTFTTDDYVSSTSKNLYPTNLGYIGWDAQKNKEKYDDSKDGFVRYLDKVEKANPETKDQVSMMKNKYHAMLEKVGYNHCLLQGILNKKSWEVGNNGSFLRMSENETLNPSTVSLGDIKFTLDNIEYQSKVVPEILHNMGFDDATIASSLSARYNDSLSCFEIYDKDGKPVKDPNKPNSWSTLHVDLLKAINPNTGKPYFEEKGGYYSPLEQGHYGGYSSSLAMKHTYYKFTGEVLSGSDAWVEEQMNQLRAFNSVTKEDFTEIHRLSSEMFGLKYVTTHSDGTTSEISNLDYNTLTSGKCQFVKDETVSSDLDLVISNLNFAVIDLNAKVDLAGGAHLSTASKLNARGTDYSGNCDFYYPSNTRELTRFKQYGNWRGIYTKDELNSQIQRQLDQAPVLSSSYLTQLHSFYDAQSNGDPNQYHKIVQESGLSTAGDSSSISVNSIINHPLKDIVYTASMGICECIPKMRTGVKNLDSAIARRLNYVPYDFTASVQPTLSKPKKNINNSSNELLQARKDAYKAINCSLVTEDSDTSLKMRKDMLKNFDYDGVSHPKIYDGKNSGGDRRVLFNSRFFKITNSNMEDGFNEYQKQLGQTPDKATYYHGTSYGSAAGIIGASGGWKFNVDARSGRMLGSGAYFGNKVGKIMPYASDQAYTYNTMDAETYGNGVIILSQLLQGAPGERTICDPDDPSNPRRGILGYETSVRNNNCIYPHHMVDVSCRSLNRSVTRDSKGNYLDSQGNITHDKFGKAIDMK